MRPPLYQWDNFDEGQKNPVQCNSWKVHLLNIQTPHPSNLHDEKLNWEQIIWQKTIDTLYHQQISVFHWIKFRKNWYCQPWHEIWPWFINYFSHHQQKLHQHVPPKQYGLNPCNNKDFSYIPMNNKAFTELHITNHPILMTYAKPVN